MATVELCGITKQFANGSLAVADVSLRVGDGELLVLAGPSGSGKSTLLRLIAGLERPTAGVVRLGGKDVTAWAPHRRNVSMVFQHDALLPHLSVKRNLEFGSKLRLGGGIGVRLRRWISPAPAVGGKPAEGEMNDRVRQAAALLGITPLLQRRPQQLSGGERQRVALGRAMLRDPAAFLFDEPLSSLDAEQRRRLSRSLREWHDERGATTLWITHDQAEAMAVADRIAVLDQGRVQQVGTPIELYREPANLMVARFIGPAPINVVAGRWCREEADVVFQDASGYRWRVPFSVLPTCSAAAGEGTGQAERAVVLGFRPEDVRQAGGGPQVELPPVIVRAARWQGDHVEVSVAPTTGLPETWRVRWWADAPTVGTVWRLAVDADRCLWFDVATEKRIGNVKQ